MEIDEENLKEIEIIKIKINEGKKSNNVVHEVSQPKCKEKNLLPVAVKYRGPNKMRREEFANIQNTKGEKQPEKIHKGILPNLCLT